MIAWAAIRLSARAGRAAPREERLAKILASGGGDVAKYALFFSLTSDALARFIETPSDRQAVVGRLAEGAGGKLESYYWMFGQYDGIVIVDVPNSATAAAIALAVTSTGAFKHVETHELIPASDLQSVLQRAKTLRGSYTPPGTPASR